MGSRTYTKGTPTSLSEHFNSTDFDCKCQRKACNITLVDDNLIEACERLYEISGGFKINSGFRCMDHNNEVGGKPNSQHLFGKAADCQSMKGLSGHAMARYAEQVKLFYSGGIGIYKSFAHCDVREGQARWAMVNC